MDNVICKCCGQKVSVSREGWTVFQAKEPARYIEWIHIVGHFNKNGKFCSESGASPASYRK